MTITDNKRCLVCKADHRTLYWHVDTDTKEVWCYCNKCDRGYSLSSYCWHAGISKSDIMNGNFEYQESRPNEVNKIDFPNWYLTLCDPRAKEGVEYIESRGLTLEGDMYYDADRKGIVFPMYFENIFCGAQTRFIASRVHADGHEQKMDTLPGTRSGLLFYGWNGARFVGDVKGVIVTEGAFNALSLQQALNKKYGGVHKNPWRVISCSGSGATSYQRERLKDLKDSGFKVICSFDSDEAGIKGLHKFMKADCITHFAITGDTEKDWNNLLCDLGYEGLAEYYIRAIKKVGSDVG